MVDMFKKIKKIMSKKVIVSILVLVVIVLGGLYYNGALLSLWGGSMYQSVFLDNGQVYFGKLYAAKSQYATLKDVYYLQVTQAPQPIRPGEQPPTNINIVKLGGELHGPTDEMRINRDHIVFVEDLKSDSRVLQAIEQFKATGQ